MITPPINDTHTQLRAAGNVNVAIELIWAQIRLRGYHEVKSDPGVRTYIMEHEAEFRAILDKKKVTP